MMRDLDADGSGCISREELTGLLTSPTALEVLSRLNITPEAYICFLEPFFEEADDNELNLPFVVEVLLELRGANSVTVQRLLYHES